MPNMVEIGDRIEFHPGYYIEEIAREEGMSHECLASKMHRSVGEVEDLVKGKTRMTSDLAEALHDVFGMSAQMWMNIDRRFWAALDAAKESGVNEEK